LNLKELRFYLWFTATRQYNLEPDGEYRSNIMHKHKPKKANIKPVKDKEFTVKWSDLIAFEDQKNIKPGTIDNMKPYSRDDQQAPE
jgi:hypothetical protein